MPRVLLTVGMNPLPVAVAARRLMESFKSPGLVVLESPQSQPETDRILALLEKELGVTVKAERLRLMNATSPREVFTVVKLRFAENREDVHLHYTGGTKAMGLQAMNALRSTPGLVVTGSYLDSGVHCLVDDRDEYVDPAYPDERRVWNLTLEDVAGLHDFTTSFTLGRGGARYQFGAYPRDETHVPNPTAGPDAEWLGIAVDMSRVLASHPKLVDLFRDEARSWEGYAKRAGGWPRLPNPLIQPNPAIRWLDLPVSFAGDDLRKVWRSVPERINQYFGRSCWSAPNLEFDPSALDPVQLDRLIALMQNGWLELAVFDSFQKKLAAAGLPHHLYHSVHLARRSPQAVERDFELDVVVILGYQAVVISCTTSGGEKEIKQKGFEAIHRARQIGGAAAHAIVACSAREEVARTSREELHNDIGSEDFPLEVWSLNNIRNLEASVERYLRSLRWE